MSEAAHDILKDLHIGAAERERAAFPRLVVVELSVEFAASEKRSTGVEDAVNEFTDSCTGVLAVFHHLRFEVYVLTWELVDIFD